MGYQWATIDANFDRSLQFTKVRWDLSQSWNDGFFSELPNINCDNKGWTSITGAEWGYAGQYNMNLSAKKCYIRNQSTDNYTLYDMYAISTQVDTNIYEYEYSVPLYWGGVSNSSLYSRTGGLGISVLVQASTFEIAPTESAATYESGTTTITINTDNDSTITWTASTNDSWLSLSTLTGAGDGSVIATYEENPSFQNRTGTITFTSNEGDVLTFTVEQEKKPVIVYDRPIYRSGNLVKKMYRSGEMIYYRLNPASEEPEPSYASMPLTFEILTGGTIVWRTTNSSVTKTIQYSLDSGSTWSNITSTVDGVSITVAQGDTIQFKGNNSTYGNSSYHSTFSGSTAVFNTYGNIMSLINGSDFEDLVALTETYNFYSFFRSTNVISAENLILPATTLATNCYDRMFLYCTSLTIGPSSIGTSATTMANYCCQYMFQGCTSLTTAPELPATTLAIASYNGMFQGCTSLTTAPELPATTLAKYCYYNMFFDCTNLNYIKCLATDIPASNCTSSWVYGVASSGTFAKNRSMTGWTTGTSGIPTNWTVVNA